MLYYCRGMGRGEAAVEEEEAAAAAAEKGGGAGTCAQPVWRLLL
jgi:hypothetical protein